MVSDGDIDIAAKTGQKAHQAFDGHVPELPVEQARHVRLAETQAFGRCSLGQVVRANDPLNSGHQFRFEQMRFGVGVAEVSKDIL